MIGQRTVAFEIHTGRVASLSACHGSPAAMIVCQKSAARNATTIIRMIRPRVSRSKVLSSGRSAGRDRSCETTRSPASEPTSPDIDKDFLNPSVICGRWQTCRKAARRPQGTASRARSRSGAIERRGRRSSSGGLALVRECHRPAMMVLKRLRHITDAAYDALASTLPKGSAVPMNCDRGPNASSKWTAVVDRIRAMRRPS